MSPPLSPSRATFQPWNMRKIIPLPVIIRGRATVTQYTINLLYKGRLHYIFMYIMVLISSRCLQYASGSFTTRLYCYIYFLSLQIMFLIYFHPAPRKPDWDFINSLAPMLSTRVCCLHHCWEMPNSNTFRCSSPSHSQWSLSAKQIFPGCGSWACGVRFG